MPAVVKTFIANSKSLPIDVASVHCRLIVDVLEVFQTYFSSLRCPDSSVSKLTVHELEGRVSIPGRHLVFFSRYHIRNCSDTRRVHC
jgi:hypothetical protein